MTLSDIAPLFERAKTGDVAALDAISDAAGELCELDWLLADDEIDVHDEWRGRYHKEDGAEFRGMWNAHGDHAPCVSADCALSLPMPKGYGRDWSEIVDAVDLFGPADEHLHVFDYTDPPNLPLALTCAALCANLHAKENADAR